MTCALQMYCTCIRHLELLRLRPAAQPKHIAEALCTCICFVPKEYCYTQPAVNVPLSLSKPPAEQHLAVSSAHLILKFFRQFVLSCRVAASRPASRGRRKSPSSN